VWRCTSVKRGAQNNCHGSGLAVGVNFHCGHSLQIFRVITAVVLVAIRTGATLLMTPQLTSMGLCDELQLLCEQDDGEHLNIACTLFCIEQLRIMLMHQCHRRYSNTMLRFAFLL
jgi:hypothetical protein